MSDRPRPNRHPDGEKLHDFSQGRMTAAEWAELLSHLDECTECCDALANLADDGDPFVARIRRLAQQSSIERIHPAFSRGEESS